MIDKVCNNCGLALSEFYRTGMLGCEHCYKAFQKQIEQTLYKIQGKAFHTGKTPYNLGAVERQMLAEYKWLLKEKERATIEGRFSDIRMLSEQILEISNELKNRGIL